MATFDAQMPAAMRPHVLDSPIDDLALENGRELLESYSPNHARKAVQMLRNEMSLAESDAPRRPIGERP
jgi:hypothetical protein